MYFYAVFNSESKDRIDCGRFWFDFFSCFFFRWDMFSSPHIGTVAFNQKWVPLIFCSLFVLEILFCVFAKLKVLFRNAPRLQICDPRSFSQIELLSCLVYEKSLGHDWGLAALNSWMNNIKSWSIFQDCHWSSWPSWSLSSKINLGRSHQVIEQGAVITWDWERNDFTACPHLEIVYFGAMLRVACFHPFL